MGKLEALGNSWSLCTLGLPEDPLGYPVSKVERTMVLRQLFPSCPCITMLWVKSVWLLVFSCLLKSISICWLNLVDSSLLLLIDVVWYLLLSRFQWPSLFDSTSLLEFRCKFPKICCLPHLSSGSKSMVSSNLGGVQGVLVKILGALSIDPQCTLCERHRGKIGLQLQWTTIWLWLT